MKGEKLKRYQKNHKIINQLSILRIISNASDAADKLRFKAISDLSLLGGDPELKVFVDFDKEKKSNENNIDKKIKIKTF